MDSTAKEREFVALPPRLRALARDLGQLDEAERDLVIRAARQTRRLRTIPWEKLWAVHGAADVGGGNAVEDCRAVLDD